MFSLACSRSCSTNPLKEASSFQKLELGQMKKTKILSLYADGRGAGITEVPDFNTINELYGPSTVMFYFRNRHIVIDLGTGNNNKINWALKDKHEFIDIIVTVYRGARKGRGLMIAHRYFYFFYKCLDFGQWKEL